MAFADESVTLPGSGLVFINYYDDSVSAPYRAAILTAENFLQSHFTNSVTVNIDFSLASLGANFAGQNNFSQVNVSYSGLVSALASHATSPDDFTAVAGFPTVDPSAGRGFAMPIAQAVALGLTPQTNADDDSVTLNSDLNWTFGQDAVGVLLHEITEGVFGRDASLGFEGKWATLDLFRFTASGQRDYTGGSDGVATFFGIDANHVTSLQYHNSINAQGVNDGFDLGDWDNTHGDSFGPGGPNSPGVVTATDLQVLDVLGWTLSGTGHDFVPAPDDFASSLTDTSAPMGSLPVGGSVSGALQEAGDRDWFAVTLQAGATYTITETGQHGGGGTLGDPYLRLHDASGATVSENDDITASGQNPDSQIVFTPQTGGTYYVDAGAFVDGYAGSYTLRVTQTGGSATGGGGGQTLQATASNPTVMGGSGDDTITAGPVADYLRGGAGDDVIFGGAAFDDINGNQGADTIHGSGGGDWLVGGQGNDVILGGGADDIILGNLGNDTLEGASGGATLRGGQGDDSIAGGSGNDYISGDRGDDTVSGGGGADLFHSFSGAGTMRVLDFSSAQGDRVMLDPGNTWTAHQSGADTVIDITGGGQVTLVGVQLSSLSGAWIFDGP
jgi:Ca2+-binding RTX toxin-like protein